MHTISDHPPDANTFARQAPGPVDVACQRALDLDVLNVTKIAAMLEKATENTPPRPAVAAGARFACDPAEHRPAQLTPPAADRRAWAMRCAG